MKFFTKIKKDGGFIRTPKLASGFTLIEIMVAMSIFIIVMLITSGSILTVFDANQKSKNLRSVMDNLNLSMESMTRTIRYGTVYHCGPTNITTPADCGGAGLNSFTVLAEDGSRVTYSYATVSGVGRIQRVVNNGSPAYITSSDVNISDIKFRVSGSLPYNTPDLLQPRVIITVKGSVGTKTRTISTFSLETMASQRQLDFQ